MSSEKVYVPEFPEPTFYGQTSHSGAVSPQLNEQSNKQEVVNIAATEEKDIIIETMRSWDLEEDTLLVPLEPLEHTSIGENVGGGACNYYPA